MDRFLKTTQQVLKIFFVAAFLWLGLVATAYANDPFTKLGRGVANTLTGWVELPKNIYATSIEENTFKGVTVGTVRGAGLSIVRTGAGIYEIVTFPFPIPEDYRAILEPEFVF